MDCLLDIISKGDTYGMQGTSLFPHRTNLLVSKCSEGDVHNGQLIFQAKPILPMGSSAQQLKAGILMPYSDETIEHQVLTFSVPADLGFPQNLGKMMLWDIKDTFPQEPTWKPASQDLQIHWHIDDASQFWMLEDRPGPLRHLELFSGGHGGWAYATRFIRQFCQTQSQIIAVEHDLPTLANYAIHHGSVIVSGEKPLPKGLIDSGLDIMLMPRPDSGCRRLHSGAQMSPQFPHLVVHGQRQVWNQDFSHHVGCCLLKPLHNSVGSVLRFWHPMEIALHHLIWDSVCTPTGLKLGWQIEGNQIATPHAALLLVNALNALPQRHPNIPIDRFFAALWNGRLQASQSVVKHFADFSICHHFQSERFHDQAISNIHQLFETIKSGHFHDEIMWSLSQGVFTQEEWLLMSGHRPYPLPSQISVPSQSTAIEDDDDVEMTAPFAAMLAGRLIQADRETSFWFQHDFQLPEFTHHWSPGFDIATCHAHWLTSQETADTGKSVEIQPCQEDLHDVASGLARVVTFVRDGQLSLYRIAPGISLDTCIAEWNVPTPVVDQFGELTTQQSAHGSVLLLPPCDHTQVPMQYPAIVLSALQSLTSFSTDWTMDTGIFSIKGQGCASCATTMSEFWSLLLPSSRLMHLGLKVQADKTPESFHVQYIPTGTTCPLPPDPFWILLSVAAARVMLDGFRDPDGQQFVLKWLSRPLWSGPISTSTTTEQIEAVLRWTLCLSMKDAVPRIIIGGRQWFLSTIAEMTPQSHEAPLKGHIVASIHGGGAKELNRTQVKNSIAATLLESGYALSQVQEIVDAVLTKAGLKKAMTIARLPGGNDRQRQILQLCKDCHVTMPEPSKQLHPSSLVGPKPKRPNVVPPTPTDYAVVPGFLCNQDATETKQIPQITSASTGVCLVDAETAKPWLRENQLISKDELALFLMDTVKPDTALNAKQILLPCTNRNDQQVIISGYLVQLGEKQVVVKDVTSQQVAMKQCQVAALTVWKDDWNEQEWKGFLKATNSTFRTALGEDGTDDSIPSIWGRSLRAKGKPATDLSAESIQVHCTVSQDAFDRLLTRSGFCKIYITPKAETGRSSDDYKIIWLKGDLAHITAQAAKTVSCAGLIRGRQSLGLRYLKTNFADAWAILCPNQDPPAMNGGTLMYKLSPLPFGCPSSAVQEWGKNHKWDVRPIKALGARTWLITTNCEPPAGIMVFNGTPVIAQFVPPRAPTAGYSHAIVAGPKPTYQGKASSSNQAIPGTAEDPWAQWSANHNAKGPAQPVSMPARSVQGPIEAQFQKQDQRISELEKTLKVMKHNQDEFRMSTEKSFHEVAHRDAQTREYVASSMDQIRKDLQTSLTQAMDKQTADLNSNMEDLKKLFRAHAKRPRNDEEEMEEDD
eukprot:s1080_g8.t1